MKNITTKITPKGREVILQQGIENLISKFSLGDTDINYQSNKECDLIKNKSGIDVNTTFNNVIIRDMIVKDTSGTTFKEISKEFNTLNNDYVTREINLHNLKGVIVDREDNNSNLKVIHVPISEMEINEYTNGYKSNTIVKDVYADKYLVIPIDDYDDLINGLHLKVTIGDIELYTSYSPVAIDADEATFDYTHDAVSINNNTSLLFSDFVKHPNNDLNKSWSDGYRKEDAYKNNLKNKYNFDINDLTLSDKMVGYVLLDNGYVVITNEEIINHYLENNEVNISLEGYSEKYVVFNEVTCHIARKEFTYSMNSTYSEGNQLKVSELGLYDNQNNLITYTKFNPPIKLDGQTPVTISIQIEL